MLLLFRQSIVSGGKYCSSETTEVPDGDCEEGYYCSGGSYSSRPVYYANITSDSAVCPVYAVNFTGDICPIGSYCPQVNEDFYCASTWCSKISEASFSNKDSA